jgi:glucokinase
MIIAGDIGGTKTVVALFEKSVEGLRLVRDARFASQDHRSLEEILEKFLHGTDPHLEVGCFGVAGPVIDGKAKTTNLPWELDERTLASACGVRRVKLLNDLEAAAYGMLHLNADEFCVLNDAQTKAQRGNIAIIAAGTGLGEALLFWDGEQYSPSASEGGHSDFAPRNAVEVGLLQYLQEKYEDHVSYERVLSGSGLFDLYRFLRESSGQPEPEWLKHKFKSGDPSAAVTEVGLAGRDPVCVRAIETFVSIYGAEAGNLALKYLALGGVIIGGGIAPKMLPVLQQGHFVNGFIAKGRYDSLLKTISVKVALNTRAPLLGAAHYALRL